MTKIVYKSNKTAESIRIAAIPTGTLFKGKIGKYQSSLFIKGYDCAISLNGADKGGQWDLASVEDYEPLDGYLDLEES